MMNAVIFDMDGVLVDSEHVITKAAIRALSEYGVHAVASDFLPFTGTGEDRFIGGVANLYGVTYQQEMKTRTYQIYLEIVDKEIHTYPGIPELLSSLRSRGLKTALASSADAIKVHANLRAAGIDAVLFDAILSGNDVERKKPFPDVFLKASEKIGVEPDACIVVEDALAGISAALSAGMACIAVSTSFSTDALKNAGAVAVCSETRDIIHWLDKI